MLEEDAELWVGLWVDGRLEHGEENVLQHLAEVRHKVPASEDVTEIQEGQSTQIKPTANVLQPCENYLRQRSTDLLDPGYLNHPFKVGRENPVLDEPAGELGPLHGIGAVDG